MSALKAYLSDVTDASKDFAECGEWFCWAAFERLMARRCCEVWLDRVAGRLRGETAAAIHEAAAGYGEAYGHYEAFRSAVSAGEPTDVSLRQRARTVKQIRRIGPLLERGVDAERKGLAALRRAVRELG